MIKNFEYRLYPTKSQERLLSQQLEICAELYNFFLNQRKTEYEQNKKPISLFQQHRLLTQVKKKNDKYDLVHSQVLQNVAVRVDLAFKGFFRRVKNGEVPGYPRFKSKHRYDSITFPQVPSGCSIQRTHLVVSKIGKIKIKQHRDLEGKPKTATIKRSATGKWCVVFSCEIKSINVQQPATNPVGIDVGIESFVHLSSNERVENPKFFKKDQKELTKAQRNLSKHVKGSRERRKAKKVVARIHERIAFRRKNFAHQESRKVINKYNPIFVEDLNINHMQHSNYRCMNKSISDAAWSMFFNFLQYKAEEAGIVCKRVNPAYTTQNCSSCGHRKKLGLSERVYSCECCGLQLSRDLNAAINIKALGLQCLGNLEVSVL